MVWRLLFLLLRQYLWRLKFALPYCLFGSDHVHSKSILSLGIPVPLVFSECLLKDSNQGCVASFCKTISPWIVIGSMWQDNTLIKTKTRQFTRSKNGGIVHFKGTQNLVMILSSKNLVTTESSIAFVGMVLAHWLKQCQSRSICIHSSSFHGFLQWNRVPNT